MKFTYLLVVIFLVSSFISEEEKIPWSENRQLTWSDFKSPRSNGSGFVASTSSGIAYSFSSFGDSSLNMEVNVKVTCNFYPNRSWYSKKDASDYILKHEQTHFDISELHARKFRKKIEETNFSEDMNTELEKLFYKFEDERVTFQKKFDKETDHSKINDKELEWEEFVANQLKKYERWK